ncbi:unnamed protein product [[Candida] boidinii]|nr:hypothetical protein B5S30_g4766 [[Candida] boidinii]OWB86636.1 hypothetical protein B5S33_g5343 [[Candida] boidinii]GMF00210.1 unnamed protein product [[Candida] boidinii]
MSQYSHSDKDKDKDRDKDSSSMDDFAIISEPPTPQMDANSMNGSSNLNNRRSISHSSDKQQQQQNQQPISPLLSYQSPPTLLKRSSSTRQTSFSSLNLENVSVFDLLDPFAVTTEISSKTYRKVKDYSTESFNKLKLKSKNRVKNFKINDDELIKLKSLINIKVDNLYNSLSKTIKTSKTEKLFYSISVYLIFFIGLIIGKYPQYLHILYSILFVILMPIRYLTYYKVGYGYYLVDLCYYVNALLMIYIWGFPESKMLYVTCFAFTFGTLSFAVITWRNSLVLHSIEKTTSSFIHILPPVVMYTITHQLPQDFKKKRFPGSVKLEEWNFYYGIFYTSILYFIWQSLYHYFITIKRAEKIKAGKVNSFEHLRKSYSKNWIGKFVNGLPEPYPVIAFTFIQYFYQLSTMILCPIFFKYNILASLFMSYIFIKASYNGATYYVDIYGKKLNKEVARLQQEIEALQDLNSKLVPSPVIKPMDHTQDYLDQNNNSSTNINHDNQDDDSNSSLNTSSLHHLNLPESITESITESIAEPIPDSIPDSTPESKN